MIEKALLCKASIHRMVPHAQQICVIVRMVLDKNNNIGTLGIVGQPMSAKRILLRAFPEPEKREVVGISGRARKGR
jgi:hypothetical protein